MTNKSCELEILDMTTMQIAFVVQLYGVSRDEMLIVPPPVSIAKMFARLGIDPVRYTTSIFHVREARGYRRR
jgi:hypothetical protein